MPEREDVAGRLPPQDLDAEQSVLGAMLLSEAAVAEATEVLKAEDFYRGGHGEIFARHARPVPGLASPSTRSPCATGSISAASLEQVGGRPAVFALAEAVPVVTNARRYAEIVREMAMLRGLIRVGTEVAQLGYDRPGDTRELLDMAEQKVYEIAQNGTRRGLHAIKQPLDEAFHRLTLLFEHGDGSGVTGLADRLRRARPADLRPAEVEPRDPGGAPVDGQDEPRAQHRRARRGDAAEAGRAVLARDVEGRDRAAAAVLGRQGRPEPPAHGPARGRRLDARHGRRWSTLGSAPLYIDDSGAMTVMEMRAKARRLAARQTGGLGAWSSSTTSS